MQITVLVRLLTSNIFLLQPLGPRKETNYQIKKQRASVRENIKRGFSPGSVSYTRCHSQESLQSWGEEFEELEQLEEEGEKEEKELEEWD